MQLVTSFIVNEPSQRASNYFEIRSKAALAKLSPMNEYCVYLPPWESNLLRFQYYFVGGAISLANANADDLIIPIQARPSGICSELIFCLPGHTLSRFSFDRYERYPLKNHCVICVVV